MFKHDYSHETRVIRKAKSSWVFRKKNEHDISSETPAVSIWTLVFNARPSEIKYFINHGEQFGEYIFGLLLVVTPLCSPLGSGRAQAIRPALSRSDPDWRGPGLRLPRPNRLTDWVETWETGVKIDADDRNSIGISIGWIVFFHSRKTQNNTWV